MDLWEQQPFPDLPFAGGRLRQWTTADADVLVEAWNDPEVARWNPVPPDPSVARAEQWIAGVDHRRTHRRAVDFVIDADGLGAVGEVGLSNFSPEHGGALIGYWVLERARGLGLATAALAAVTGWAHDELDLQIVVARCHTDNRASHRVASRAGYRLEAHDASSHALWRSRAGSPGASTR